jgi:hypothetical protein
MLTSNKFSVLFGPILNNMRQTFNAKPLFLNQCKVGTVGSEPKHRLK